MMQDKNDLQLFVPKKTKQNRALLKKKRNGGRKQSGGRDPGPLPKSVIRRRPLHHPFNQRKKELFLGRLAPDSTNIQAKYTFT